MTLRDYIIEYRNKNNLSQRQFAIKCNLSNGFISMIENNYNPKTEKPVILSPNSLKKLAVGMEIPLEHLLAQAEDAASMVCELYDDFVKVTTPWEDEFKRRVIDFLQSANKEYLEKQMIDSEYINWEINESTADISFERACEIADNLGLSIDYLVGRSKFIGKAKKLATNFDDELSEKKRHLIEAINLMDESDVAKLSAHVDRLVARQKK